jgi:hypothetical protein
MTKEQRMFNALADARINIQNITTPSIKISCIISKEDGPALSERSESNGCMMRLSCIKRTNLVARASCP